MAAPTTKIGLFRVEMDKTGREYVRQHMPLIGLGTYQIRSKKVIHTIVDAALGAGYRFIDTAQVYGNEGYIGEALSESLPKHGLKREDVIITTKISPANQGREKSAASIEKSLAALHTDYIDIVIIHWPGTSRLDVKSPKNAVNRRETWEVLEDFHKRGVIRVIGVSNYEICHLKELFEYATVLPALNQVEYHPHFHQNDLVEFCKEHDIHFQAYSSLGSPDAREQLFNDPDVRKLAEKYNVAVPILLLAWGIAQEISVLPRSSSADHVIENFSAKDVRLEWEDVQLLMNNGKCEKACWDPATVH